MCRLQLEVQRLLGLVSICGRHGNGEGCTALLADRVGIPKFISIMMTIATAGYLILSFIGKKWRECVNK